MKRWLTREIIFGSEGYFEYNRAASAAGLSLQEAGKGAATSLCGIYLPRWQPARRCMTLQLKGGEPLLALTQTKQEVEHTARFSGATIGGMMSQVWFITGSSRGLGRAFAEAALASGFQVAATAATPKV